MKTNKQVGGWFLAALVVSLIIWALVIAVPAWASS